MNIVPPITITDAMLISSNVEEGPAADYDSGTTYAAGDVVSPVSSTSLKLMYASLQDGNTGHTPGGAGSDDWWRAMAYAAEAYDAGMTYAAEDGAQIDGANVHQLWWSVVDDNTANSPSADAGDHWLLMSPTNRWAMFDLALGFGVNDRIATRWGGLIDVTVAPDADLDTIVAWVIDADTVQVTVTDSGSSVIYDETVTLTGDAAEVKWQLDGVARLRSVLFEDVVFTAGSQVRVQIAKPGGIAVCAELLMGLGIDAGATMAPANVGIKDYSVIQPDDFGTFKVNKRAWHRRGSFQVNVADDDLDPCMDLLTKWRGTPMLFVGASIYRSSVIFGFFRSFEQVLSFPDAHVLQIDLESI